MTLVDTSLRDWFGDIDIYLFDQILRGRITPGMRILDAGCGSGRNLVYFMRAGYDVAGVDQSAASVEATRALATRLAPRVPADAFRVEAVERLSFAPSSVDVVISSAILHFARDEAQFRAMLDAMWRTLRPGGLFFARLASSIGMTPAELTPLGGRRFTLPDGSDRFLVDEDMLMTETGRLGGRLVDPLKTTVVQRARCMTTWVLDRNDL
ncbi:MAG TPA: class I SAM-dependent methyltransferase [Gemmatimonadaceae bacterium]|nr:class I SAM-dependent methyltransferase [Gemmatimonadaceae bacterium]